MSSCHIDGQYGIMACHFVHLFICGTCFDISLIGLHKDPGNRGTPKTGTIKVFELCCR